MWLQFDWNLSRCPFLGQVVDLDLLLCIGFKLEHTYLFQCPIFAQIPMNDWKIESSNKSCIGLQQCLANSSENFISHEKTKLFMAQNLQSIKTFLTLELTQCSKNGSIAQASLSLPAATSANLVTPCVCACLSNPPKLCQSAAARALLWFFSKNLLIVFCSSLWEWLSDDLQALGLQFGLELELCRLTNEFYLFYLLRIPK